MFPSLPIQTVQNGFRRLVYTSVEPRLRELVVIHPDSIDKTPLREHVWVKEFDGDEEDDLDNDVIDSDEEEDEEDEDEEEDSDDEDEDDDSNEPEDEEEDGPPLYVEKGILSPTMSPVSSMNAENN